jgi:hypothetical protein
MAQFPKIIELRQRAEFQHCETYLHTILTKHPRLGMRPSLIQAFRSRDAFAAEAGETLHDDEAKTPSTVPDVTPAATPMTDPSDTSDASGPQSGGGTITPNLVSELISVWMLSVAQQRAATPLLGTGGLYLLNMPASAGGNSSQSANDPFERA